MGRVIEVGGVLGEGLRWPSIEDVAVGTLVVERTVLVEHHMAVVDRMAVVQCTVVAAGMAVAVHMGVATLLIIPAVTGIPAAMSLREAPLFAEGEAMEADGGAADTDPVLEGQLRVILTELLLMRE